MKQLKKEVGIIMSAFLYLLLFSGSTSPLFPYDYGWDSALFILVGKSLRHGKALYADMFDHKGPVIFIIEALGDWIHSGYGIFFLQIIFLYVTLRVMMKLFRQLCGGLAVWPALLIFLLFLAYPFANGNLTEEYSLIFIIYPLYLSVKSICGNTQPTQKEFMIYGLCFAVLAFLRLNNAIMIAGLVLFWIPALLKEKRYRILLENLLFGLLGILAVTIPFLLYFLARGTLQDMLYATFTYNFLYGSDGFLNQMNQFRNGSYLLRQAILYFPLMVSGWIYVKYVSDKKLRTLLLLLLGVNMLCLLYGKGYNHYFTIAVPLTGIAGAIYLENARHTVHKVTLLKIAACTAAAGYLFLSARILVLNIYRNYCNDEYRTQCEALAENFARIPSAERDSIIGYNIHSRCYLMGDILPAYKYYTAQDAWAQNDRRIIEDFYDYLYTEQPLWIVTEADPVGNRMAELLQQNYELKLEDEYCKYYRIVEKS